MGTRYKPTKALLLITLICVLVSAGCSNTNQQQVPQQQSAGQEKKNPDKLREIETNVEAMIGMLSGVPQQPVEPRPDIGRQTEGGQQDQGSQQTKGGEEQSGANNQEGSEQDQQKAQMGGQLGGLEGQTALLEPKPLVNWPAAMNDAEKIHIQWNEYISQAAKDGISKNNIDGFSGILNNLTSHIGSKNRAQALLEANNLNLQLANFWMMYDTKVPPDLKRIKHYTRNVIFYADLEAWDKAESNLDSCKDLFQGIRTTASKEQQDLINKIDFSIQEMEKVVKRRSGSLVKLKGKLAVDNITELEKNMEASK